jgi:hypothetical protein
VVDQEPSKGKASREFLRDLFQASRVMKADKSGIFSLAALDNFIKQSNDQLHSAKWHREQVNAMLKSRYADCGKEGIFTPPSESEDGDVSSSFIGNTIISDKAAAAMLAALDDSGNTTNPDQPPPVNPPAGVKPPWWKILLGTLLSVLIGSLIVFLAWKAFGGQPRYELIAEPFEIPEQIEFTR